MTLVCTAIVEKAGRKILLLIGIIGMCISSFLLVTFRVTGVLMVYITFTNILVKFNLSK